MRRLTLWTSALLTSLVMTISACGGGGGGNALVAPRVSIAGALDQPASYSAADLAAQPVVTQPVSFTSGNVPQAHVFTGTSLWSLLTRSGIKVDATPRNDILNRYVLATAEDGYRAVFSLGELNPEFGNQPNLVAYHDAVYGVPVGLGSDGPFRITAPGDIKGGRYVSNLTRLEVRASGSAAGASGGGTSVSFAVSGAVLKPARFDLAALQSLPAVTQTVGGSVYTGVSLWSLLNSTTGLQTSASAKNPTLGMYAVATGSDGYKALVSLGEIDPGFGNRNALVAYLVNGSLLDRNGVARLVVPGDIKLGRSVSNLVSIEVFTAP